VEDITALLVFDGRFRSRRLDRRIGCLYLPCRIGRFCSIPPGLGFSPDKPEPGEDTLGGALLLQVIKVRSEFRVDRVLDQSLFNPPMDSCQG
jgi:hypothetical protein